MLLRKVLAQPAKNVSESLGDRAAVATPATLPPWLPTAFSVGAYVFLGPKPAIFVAVSMILLTYVGGLLSLPLPVQVVLSCLPAATTAFVNFQKRGAATGRAPQTVAQSATIPEDGLGAARLSSTTRAASHAVGQATNRESSPSFYSAPARGAAKPPVAAATNAMESAAHVLHIAKSATAAIPTGIVPAVADDTSANCDRSRADPRAMLHRRHARSPPQAVTTAGPAVACGDGPSLSAARPSAGPSSSRPPPSRISPTQLTPGALEAGLGAASRQDFTAASSARTAAWAAAVSEAAEVEAAKTVTYNLATVADRRPVGALTAQHMPGGTRMRVRGSAPVRCSAGVEDLLEEISNGEQGLWSEMPLTAFSEVVRMVGESERRSIRLVCREWCSAAGACTTHLSPPRGAFRHLDTLAVAFPFITSLDLSAALHHITPSRIRHVAAMRHLSSLTLGCPNPGSTPGSRIGFSCTPGGSQISASSFSAAVGGSAVAVTDGCVRELALSLATAQRNATAMYGFGSGFGGIHPTYGMGGVGGGGPMATAAGSLRTGPAGPLVPGLGLRVLSLARCVHVSDAGLLPLAHLASLTSLDLTGCVSVSDVGIMVLARLPALAMLELAWCLKVSNAGLRALAMLPRLAHLSISGCPLVSEAGVRGLTAVSSLRSIDLTYLGTHRAAVTDATLASLAAHLNLTHVALGGGNDVAASAVRVSDAGLMALADACPHLKAVTLLGLRDVTDVGVAALAASLTELTAFVVRSCGPGVTRGCLGAVAAAVTRHVQRDVGDHGDHANDHANCGGCGLQELNLLYNPFLELHDEDVARLCALPPQASDARRSDALQRNVRGVGNGGVLYSLGLGGFLALQLPPLAHSGPGLGAAAGVAGGSEAATGLGLASLRALGRLTWLTSLSLVCYSGSFWVAAYESSHDGSSLDQSSNSLMSGSRSGDGRGTGSHIPNTSDGAGRGRSIGGGSSGRTGGPLSYGSVGSGSRGNALAALELAASGAASVPLTSLRQLQYLDMSGAVQLDDIALAAVAQAAQRLQTLIIPRCTRVTDAGLEAAVARLRELQVLNLSNCHRITDNGLAYLAHLHRLSQLILKNCPAITDAGVAALAPLRRLELLDLAHAGTRVTGAGFAAFSGRSLGTRLASLALSYCGGLGDRGLGVLCVALRGLMRLDISGCNALSDAGGTCLGRLPLLTDVDLSHCARIGDATLSALAPLRLLAIIKMPGCVRISDEGLAAIAAAGATNLSPQPPPLINDSTSAPDSPRHHARVLLQPAVTVPQTVATINPNTAMPGSATPAAATSAAGPDTQQPITTIADVSGGDSGSGSGSPCPSNASPVLCLHLDSCISITDVGLMHLASLTSLTSLRLARCAAVTDAGVAALAALTRLCNLSLAHCPAVTQGGLLALSGITSLASLEF